METKLWARGTLVFSDLLSCMRTSLLPKSLWLRMCNGSPSLQSDVSRIILKRLSFHHVSTLPLHRIECSSRKCLFSSSKSHKKIPKHRHRMDSTLAVLISKHPSEVLLKICPCCRLRIKNYWLELILRIVWPVKSDTYCRFFAGKISVFRDAKRMCFSRSDNGPYDSAHYAPTRQFCGHHFWRPGSVSCLSA